MNDSTRWLSLALASAMGITSSCASPARAQDSFVFRDVRVFDGKEVIRSTTVVVQGGLIAAIGPGAAAPEGAKIIDGAGRTLLPGLIDSHTHTFSPDHLAQAAVFGVTTELDMFTDHKFAAQMRSQQAPGGADTRADLLSAGILVTAPGGHGTEYGLEIPTITAPEQADGFVKARLAEGSDYIKIIYDNGSAYGLSSPTISRETLAAVIRATHERGKLAVAHISTQNGARDALEAGIDGLMHVFADKAADDPLVKLAVDKRAFVVPTLTVVESASGVASGESLVSDPDLSPFLMPAEMSNLKKSFPKRASGAAEAGLARETVGKLRAAGVPLLAGSDAPNPGTAHGASIHRELELLVAAGLPPVEALAAATSRPAEKFGLADRGRIAPKLRADLVLVEGDPTTEIKTSRKLIGVWKHGRPIDRDAYHKRVEAEVEKVARAKTAPAPPGSESGLVSDFEGEKVQTTFGSSWSVSTDKLFGGQSTGEFKLAEGGALDSKGSLLIRGNIASKSQQRFAGAMFTPAATMFAPANLSSKQAISFWAKGDGKTYAIMVFFQSRGFIPSSKSFVAGNEWKKYRFMLEDFDGCDGSDILGVFFGGGGAQGEFEFQIDEVRFEKREGTQ